MGVVTSSKQNLTADDCIYGSVNYRPGYFLIPIYAESGMYDSEDWIFLFAVVNETPGNGKSFFFRLCEIYNSSQWEYVSMVKVPCQEIVWDIIPAIQAALASELVNLGVSQIQIAKSLSIAPSAVSQYLSGKRGYRIVFDDEIKDVISKLAEEIKSGSITDDELEGKFCNICRSLRGRDECSRTSE